MVLPPSQLWLQAVRPDTPEWLLNATKEQGLRPVQGTVYPTDAAYAHNLTELVVD